MVIDRHTVAEKLTDYLYHKITLGELVDWAEWAMMKADFEEKHIDTVRDIVARLGLADVRAFSLSWSDCEDMLHRLGYQVRLQVLAA
jgi:cobyrinic acid a,c-diamide synthase